MKIKWNNIEDSIPNEETPVFLFHKDHPNNIFVGHRYCDNDGWYWYLFNSGFWINDIKNHDDWDDYVFTHWAEMIEPPEA